MGQYQWCRGEVNKPIILSWEVTSSMNEFKEEFLQLLERYGSIDISINKDVSETSITDPKLTNEEIVNVIQEVIRETFKISLQNMEDAAMKTPANEIVITTPNAPDVLRVDYNQNNTLPTSDEVTEVTDNKTSIIDADTVKQKNKKNDSSLVNKSKQSLNTTYIRGAMLNKIKQDVPKLGSPTNITMYMVDEAYKNAAKLMQKLDDLKELLTSEIKPNTRLSNIIRLPITSQHKPLLHHQQQTAASIQRSKALRRYVQQASNDASITPTSSRSSITQARPGQLPKKNFPKLEEKRSLDECNRTTSEASKVSSRSPMKSQSRNPKYAHVKSTVPKHTISVLKRKPEWAEEK